MRTKDSIANIRDFRSKLKVEMGKSNAKTKFEVPREDNKAYELTKLMSLDIVDSRRRYFVAKLNHFGQNAVELITCI